MLLALIGEHGMAGVSVRSVAAAAGCSVGAVQKYFATKDEMLLFAADLAGEQTLDRIRSVDPNGPPRETVRQWLLATAPLDPESRAQSRVWLEFTTRAVAVPEFGRLVAETDQVVAAALAGYLAEIWSDTRGFDAQATADALIAVIDGLTLRLLSTAPPDLTGPVSPAAGPGVLEAVLDRVLAALLPADPPPFVR